MFTLLLLDRPSIYSPVPTVNVSQGSSIQLNCTFDGLPALNILWYGHSGCMLGMQPQYPVQSTTMTTSLTISPFVGGVYNGAFTCLAYNILGSSSSTVQVFYQGEVVAFVTASTRLGVVIILKVLFEPWVLMYC